MTAALEIDGLGKDYHGVTAVGALSLEVPRGALLGLLGPNGAGKTTSISMVAGVVTPSRGTARIDGHDIVRERFAARAALGLVPQDLALYDDLSPRENLRYFGGLYGLRGSALGERIDWALDIARLRDRARDRVSEFSGGMKRRLNLVAGLLHRPTVLILDEPTVGVDPQSRAHIFDSLRSLRDDGMTIVYTSHYMDEVESLCDRVAIIDRGALIAVDSIHGLVAAHARDAVEVRVKGDPSAYLAPLEALGEASLEGDRLVVQAAVGVAAIARAVEDAGGELAEIVAVSPNLESVFLALTGHGLRD